MNIQITSTQDFLDALRDNPEFLEAARKEFFTKELIQLPARLDRDFAEVRDKIDEVSDEVGQVRDEVGRVKGVVFGIDIDRKGMPQMVAAYGLRRTRIVRLAENNRASEEFNEAVLDARDNGVITRSEYGRIVVTDTDRAGQTGAFVRHQRLHSG